LYQNNGDGTFTNRATEFGFGVLGVVKGGVGDYDNDGRLDLCYIAFREDQSTTAGASRT
jgi:hypothetical protein